MAKLKFSTGFFEIKLTPSFEADGGKWFPINILFSIANDDILNIENKQEIHLTQNDISRLIENTKQFINLRVNIDDNFPVVSIDEFTFVPMELGFQFSCLDGDVDKNLFGEITLRIMINLELIRKNLSSTYVGAEFNVDAQTLIRFLQDMEREFLHLPTS